MKRFAYFRWRVTLTELVFMLAVITAMCGDTLAGTAGARTRRDYRTHNRISETVPSLESFFNHGLWICESGENFDRNVLKFYHEGKIKVTDLIMDQMSDDCQRVDSDNLQISDCSSDGTIEIDRASLPAEARDKLANLGVPTIGIYSYFWYMHSHVIQPNQSNGDNAWLCPTQDGASHLGQDIGYYSWKIKITREVLTQLAAENSCGITKLAPLTPVEIAEPYCGDFYDYCYAIKVADKNRSGWMPLGLYLAYARKHKVSPR